MKTKRKSGAIRRIVMGLPLAGVVAASFLPLGPTAHQFLVLAVIVWFQMFILLEVFSRSS